MKLGQRKISKLIGAFLKGRHYGAFARAVFVCPDLADFYRRYLLSRGEYPCRIRLRTPVGMIAPEVFSYYDVLTVNEIFCRRDYAAGPEIRTVVDLGANIGLSALYFLTRNRGAKCYLCEPVPMNIERLKNNLSDFQERYVLRNKAIAPERGTRPIGLEPTGRYCGFYRQSDDRPRVDCITVNDVLAEVLDAEEYIDILKIDIEGNEPETAAAIRKEFLPRIKTIYLEIGENEPAITFPSGLGDSFKFYRRGGIYKLIPKLN